MEIRRDGPETIVFDHTDLIRKSPQNALLTSNTAKGLRPGTQPGQDVSPSALVRVSHWFNKVGSMNITSRLLEAYLQCPTKSFLRSRGEMGTGNEYADWAHAQGTSYRN